MKPFDKTVWADRMPTLELPGIEQIPVDVARAVRSAYLHIPFCTHKCGYCDFASVAGQDEWMAPYVDALAMEIDAHLGAAAEVDTIFIGGGTPTLLPPALLRRCLQSIRQRFPLAAGGEFTVEANPNTLTAEKVEVLAEAGVNRVSLGAQSFEPRLLKALERDHDPDSVRRAAELVRERIGNFSLDLIFGVPGQTLDDWQRDLDKAFALQPDHLSTYGLTYEKGTPLWRQRKLAVLVPVEEDVERAMFEYAIERAASAYWTHYEISNFARPGRECRHNLAYWANDDCFGFGVGAASYVGGVRRLNLRDVPSYVHRARAARSCAIQVETLDIQDRARETAMLNLRRRLGIDRVVFHAKTGFAIDVLAGHAIARFSANGLLIDDGNTIRLSDEGVFFSDAVLREFV